MNRFDVVALGLTAFCVCAGVNAAGDPAASLSHAEVARVIEHGPWPPDFSRDPTNRVSGNRDAIDLGRRLFFYPRFSPNGYIACVACHQPDRSFTDNLPRARGLAPVERNAVALQNLRLHRWYGWGGASDSLWMASLRPILDPREIGANAATVASIVQTGDGVACRYKAAFGDEPSAHDAETVLVNVAKALAAYEETLVTGRTPFDDYRDALARGDTPPTSYPVDARRGIKIFFGRGNCHACHKGANFTDDAFRGTAVRTFIGQDVPDAGRIDALRYVRASRYNLSGPYNDDPAKTGASAVRDAKFEPLDHARWRTPSLRNVAVTAPYLHNGTAATLYDVVRRYARAPGQWPYIDDERRIRRVDLSPRDVDDLVAFLETLTDIDGERRPLTPLVPTVCD